MGFVRHANSWVSSGCELLGFVAKGFAAWRSAAFRRDANFWIPSRLKLLGFGG